MNTYKLTHEKAEAMVFAYEPKNAYDNRRLEAAIRRLRKNAQAGYPDAGIAGKIFEILYRPSTSRLIDVVRNQGFATCDARTSVWGKRMPIEIKTQGGRLGHLMRMTPHAQENTVLIYYGCLELTGRKNKPDELLEVQVVCILADFLRVLEETKGAIKMTGHQGVDDWEPAIQVTQRTLKALQAVSVDHIDRNNLASYF